MRLHFYAHIAGLIWLSACSNVSQIPQASKFYKRELEVKVNGALCSGACVVKRAPKYTLEVNAPADMDYLSIETCHRHVTKEDLGDSFTYDYVPLVGVEDGIDCAVEITTLDKKHAKNGYAYIEFESDLFTLSSLIKCNGQVYQAQGVSICQSKKGLSQVIEFKEPVKVSPDDSCPLDAEHSGSLFEFHLPRGACLYLFQSKSGDLHKLITLGSEDQILEKL